jgi:UDP-N-acetylglucosamine--N-acetylmuramyl-(pentapeptide) pyrophosphoryl-undecaprenol N-acetylglucosamine transferase
MTMKVLLSGGGTAGHINPALAIAEKIRMEIPDAEIAFVGTPRGMENRLVEKAGYKIYHVDVKGFQRKLTLKNLSTAWKAVTSPLRAGKIIKEFKPDIVIGTGGYVSWPVVKAASSRKIPTLIHEQNAQAGVTTRMLSAVCDKVMISFEATRSQLRAKSENIILTGNPVRPELFRVNKEAERSRLSIPDAHYIVSCGGSLGARAINEAMLTLVKNKSLSSKGVFLTHAVGSYEWERRQGEISSLEKDSYTEVCEYIYDMPSRMCAADLVICRAGAITLAELAVLGKPAILIPSPYVTDNHQYKNAKVVENGGAAVVIEEKDLTPELLEKMVFEILSDSKRLEQMQKCARALAINDTHDRIWKCIKELVKE